MLPTPTQFTLVAGAAEGQTELTAFDGAILAAGIGNLNLVRVTSILPPGCEYQERLAIPPGSLVPTAYGWIASHTPGERIAAAVAAGQGRSGYGVIVEHAARGTREDLEAIVRRMVEEAFARRGLELVTVRVAAAEHVVEHLGAVVAAVPLWS